MPHSGFKITSSLCAKTLSMCFLVRRKICNGFTITTDQKEIEKVNEFKYLSVIDPLLKFEAHIKKVSKTIKAAVGKSFLSYLPVTM